MPVQNATMTEAVYTFIYQYRKGHDFSPSLREIGSACFIGRSTVYRHLDRLEAQGRLAREPGCARGITLLDLDKDK